MIDSQRFLAEFRHIANAPGGVARLRELVYQFAVTGRIVAQSPQEGTAKTLLENAANIRNRYIHEKRWKRAPKLESAPITPPAIELPASWRWTRLLDLGEINPRNIAQDNSGATFVPMAAISENHGVKISGEEAIWGDINQGYTHFANGDVLLAKITPCFENGKAAIVSGLPHGIGAGSTEYLVFRPMCLGINPGYIYLFVRSPLFRARGEVSMTGTAGQKRLPTEYFALCAMPLPPSDEQSRIVAKVDELMALCDRLEAQQDERRRLQNTLRQSTLQAVAAATSPHELRTAWTRLESNFGQMFSVPEDVAEFKSMVLDLAVSGKLLPPEFQKFSTGLALLETISKKRIEWVNSASEQEKKEALGMMGKLRTQCARQPQDPLPEQWCWASLLQISQVVVDCHNKTAPYVSNGIHLIRTTDIRNGEMDLSKTRKISEDTYAYWSRRVSPVPGDIFFTREAPMGEAAIVPEGNKVCLGQRTMLIRLFPDLFSNKFLLYVIMSPRFQRRMFDSSIGMTVKHLRVGGVEDLMVPVPSKREQDMIVGIISHIFQRCDSYIKQIGKKINLAKGISSGSIAILTGININLNKDDSVKAPQTELIAPLRLGALPDVQSQAPLATLLARHRGEMSARDLWQRYGREIDVFYAQLKTEVAHGWIKEPTGATMRELVAAPAEG